jgi:branched-chain amino acid aminotransferase
MAKFNFLQKAFLQGKWLDFQDANISIGTQALHYGTAAFGGLRARVVKNGAKKEVVLFRLDKHAKRLSDSAKLLGAKNEEFTKPEYIKGKILEFVDKNSYVENDIYIRPLVYTSEVGIAPNLNVEKDLLIYGVELGNYFSGAISVCISSLRRQEDNMIPGKGKITGSYYISSFAKAEAQNRGFDDAILLNMSGKVSEGSAMNIFMVKDGVLYTTPTTENILEGITRDSVMKLAEHLGIKVVERQIDVSELYLASEVFFTGTAAKITSCKKIEMFEKSEDMPICKKLSDELEKVFSGENQEFKDWLTKINF